MVLMHFYAFDLLVTVYRLANKRYRYDDKPSCNLQYIIVVPRKKTGAGTTQKLGSSAMAAEKEWSKIPKLTKLKAQRASLDDVLQRHAEAVRSTPKDQRFDLAAMQFPEELIPIFHESGSERKRNKTCSFMSPCAEKRRIKEKWQKMLEEELYRQLEQVRIRAEAEELRAFFHFDRINFVFDNFANELKNPERFVKGPFLPERVVSYVVDDVRYDGSVKTQSLDDEDKARRVIFTLANDGFLYHEPRFHANVKFDENALGNFHRRSDYHRNADVEQIKAAFPRLCEFAINLFGDTKVNRVTVNYSHPGRRLDFRFESDLLQVQIHFEEGLPAYSRDAW